MAAGYEIEVVDADAGWRVVIARAGETLLERRCATGAEAETFASTVRQHAGWLSEARFREYYRLGAASATGEAEA